MSLHATWAACAVSIARCLVATTPALADWMFGAARDAGAQGESGWFRLPDPFSGYVFLAPHGADQRYQARPPAGLDRVGIRDAPAVPRGRLRIEAEAFLRDARVLAGGSAIRINGGRIPIEATSASIAAASGVVTTLEAALALLDPVATAGLLRDVALGFLRNHARIGAEALEMATRTADALRAGYGSHAPLWALSQVRAVMGAGLLEPVSPLLYMMFDPFGPGAEPETALRKAITDLVAAGQTDGLAGMQAVFLVEAESARDRALGSRSVVAHGTALYEAAGCAWAARQLAETSDTALAEAAQDIVLRATHALVIDCINLGSGAALLRHREQIVAAGPTRADELIESWWFYPRALRDTLIAQP